MNMIFEMLSYPFVVRALVGGILVSLCCCPSGVSLVLKRYSMIGDGLSHVSFGALSIAVAAGWSPLKVPSRWWCWQHFSCSVLPSMEKSKVMRLSP